MGQTRRIDGWANKQTDQTRQDEAGLDRPDEQSNGQPGARDKQTTSRTNTGRPAKQMDRRTNRQVDGWMDG